MADAYTLDAFVADLRAAVGGAATEKAILAGVKPLAVRLAASPDLRARVTRQCDAEQGFGFQLLHEEPDHALAVALFNWLPGRGTPPHDHGTWGVVVGVEGDEVNTFWQRVDDGARDGHAELRKLAEKRFVPGDAIVLPSTVIHSVWNDTAQVSVSLHVYGRHINHTGRSQFDPEAQTVRPWTVRQTE
jgi:predicted metal-dependent enzyme (double-stranded beta helix superfamily)